MRAPKRIAAAAALLGASWIAVAASGAESRCFGEVSDGRLESGIALPRRGSNFAAYSALAATLGRTYVHATVSDIVADAYAEIAATDPEYVYVYGETGLSGGGPFPPHRTHQNGLSVDFFVPVRDGKGKPAALPTHAGNRFGYDIEFDRRGRHAEYAIDFPAMAEHLYRLHRAAESRGAGIALVIFERAYLPALFATPRGAWLRRNLSFMQRDPWVRHDEHYHVDFALPCAPLGRDAGR
ncbi:penicillin-insensitive murein endopeptidase [Luteimonas sp. SJ-92]|uniref:Penicillin-insensitive murein endopeptidase n=1 Tax=Luteimonas salinisoli TaxID=2752307 RepID=A0A853JBR6_9GAMM|nr:penicillin-insensitive murein endopeptidase [Luteimonas salinisoli]NZA26194.1 penicillin-insensitive murein endopeptidase [Luteimonas salinisoli]